MGRIFVSWREGVPLLRICSFGMLYSDMVLVTKIYILMIQDVAIKI